MRLREVRHEFVEFMPEELCEGMIYVSVRFNVASHKCCCGCGTEVSTPLSPVAWKVTYDGKTVSLCPSIGSWDLPCRSHYWIRKNRVKWTDAWSQEQIDEGRLRDHENADRYFDGLRRTESHEAEALPDNETPSPRVEQREREGFWRSMKRRWKGWWRT